ncbi:Uncharacterised protein [Algoriella xinjiangensis]|uniref:DUF4270 family protein n=1 Tax=Algoriella xinjiangensis TaxID=684065 RepID=UPI000F63AAD8|nr:DUF4270 family protein [Algoriella xinjiangensis]VDH17399.1 Uncharacterised protein [Algoriella xinjiangensis]
MKNFLNVLSISIAMVIAMGAVVSCEDEALGLGNNVIGGEADGNMKSLDVIAYNDTVDTIRSDRFVLQNGTFGVYKENVFGSTSSKFYAQFRPSSIGDQDFGKETKIDSVNLVVPVFYSTTKDPLSRDTINLSNPGKKSEEKDTILITTKYAVDSLYGNKDLKMTLKVRDISTPLFRDTKYFSKLDGSQSPITTNSAVIGTVTIGSTVENKVVKVKSATASIYSETVGYKVLLDRDYFNEKIIKNAKTGLLGDYATFIRENIKGIEFSVDEDNGFIVNFKPSNISLNMYYSYKNPTDKKDGEKDYKERLNATYGFDFTNQWSAGTANSSNVLVNQIKNDFAGTPFGNAVASPNKIEGDARLYLNGMSGSQVNLKFNQAQLDSIKNDVDKNGMVIIGAKLKFFIDNDVHKFPKPPYIVAWNNYTKDSKVINELYSDVLEFYNAYPTSVHFNPMVKGDTDYYTIDVTKHLKSMIEKGNAFENQSMIITMGNFITSVSDATTINSTNPYQNNRAYNPYRIVLHGNKSEVDAKKLKLLVYYSVK